jgi:hypothetical protein
MVKNNLNYAINFIKSRYSSSLGGTEIYNPLKYAYSQKRVGKEYPRIIFLLTDGDIS